MNDKIWKRGKRQKGCIELFQSITGDVIVQGHFDHLGASREGALNAGTSFITVARTIKEILVCHKGSVFCQSLASEAGKLT
jgi:hypothetical protein